MEVGLFMETSCEEVCLMEGKVCIVTGGANGIGKCLVKTFVEQGATVFFIDKDVERGEALYKDLGARCHFYHGDVANPSDMTDFIDRVVAQVEGVDILVNNACFSHQGIVSGCTYEQFNEVLQVGVTAPFMLTQLLLPYFREGASVVNIASTRAMQSQANTESYSAAKGGILALTHALAISLAGRVRVNAISPGWIDTGETGYEPTAADVAQHPSKRIGNPADIARAVLFLTHRENSFINGENIVIDGGMSKLMTYHGDGGWTFNL